MGSSSTLMSSHTVLYVGTTALCKAEKDGQTISTETEFHMEYVNISINCSSSFLLDVVQSRNRNLWLSGYVTKQTVRMCVGVILLLYMFHRHITCLHAGCLSKSKPGILIFSEEAADKLSFTDLFSKNKLINTENRRDSADLVSVNLSSPHSVVRWKEGFWVPTVKVTVGVQKTEERLG